MHESVGPCVDPSTRAAMMIFVRPPRFPIPIDVVNGQPDGNGPSTAAERLTVSGTYSAIDWPLIRVQRAEGVEGCATRFFYYCAHRFFAAATYTGSQT